MNKFGVVEIALALLTATPVLAQMSQAPASTSNTGGTKGPANGAPSAAPGSGSTRSTTGYGNPNGRGFGPTNPENVACSSAGTAKPGVCTLPPDNAPHVQAPQF
ncbi:MAG TPA: hypothetical protein VMU22_12630 [Rhizomicrobium sp.]|nr:hypothetical protein [Rhizomicrobium sp.]